MPLDNKISNIIGVRAPEWMLTQIATRSEKNSTNFRDNANLLYLANKTAWVRLVSSVNISEKDISYFKNILGDVNITDEAYLAKQYALFGGTSIYLNKDSYKLRSGISGIPQTKQKDGAYGMLGKEEIKQFGYRPMPGITSVTIETLGRLGSVRSASVQIKCWDKSQLDIIDTLYFKLGYTMFLEWGHTYYYPSYKTKLGDRTLEPGKVYSTEFFSIDPFDETLKGNKEEVYRRIARNCRDSEGNYDGMLGIVTNFNFSYNQEGGYDCSLKVTALGYLSDYIKINNPQALPNLLREEVKAYNNLLKQIEETKRRQEEQNNKLGGEQNKIEQPAPETFENYLKKYSAYNDYKTFYASNKAKKPGNEDAGFTLFNPYVPVTAIRNIRAIIPAGDGNDYIENTRIKIDGNKILNITPQFTNKLLDKNYWGTNIEVLRENLFEFKYEYTSKVNNDKYGIFIEAGDLAYIDEQYLEANQIEKIIDESAVESTLLGFEKFIKPTKEETANRIKQIISKPDNSYRLIKSNPASAVVQVGLRPAWVIEFIAGYTKKLKVQKKAQPGSFGTLVLPPPSIEEIPFRQTVRITFDDSFFISGVQTGDIKQPDDYLVDQKKLSDQDTGKTSEGQSENQTASVKQTDSPLYSMSNIESMLRLIQLFSLNQAIANSGDLDLDLTINKIPLTDYRGFIQQLFSVGIFQDMILDLIDQKIPDADYDQNTNLDGEYRKRVNAKYGFASNLMGNKEFLYEKTNAPENNGNTEKKAPDKNFTEVDYKSLLTTYVVPYNKNQNIEDGTALNHPVYIQFGALLMLLNHSCTLFDTSKPKIQTPLIYIDFNPNHNFCLSSPKQLSTNPFTALIPFEGTDRDYRDLFNQDILNVTDYNIKPLSGSSEVTPLFRPKGGEEGNRDYLSSYLPKFKYAEDGKDNLYKGKIMNVLINIDYVMGIIKSYGTNNEENKVFLKPLLEQILSDINKSLGNFNIFRLSYNDSANSLQIVDDQIIPAGSREKMLYLSSENNAKLPLVGKTSIAKSLDIKTEVSSKLSNMIAISVNSENKSTASTNGDNFGYINTMYKDRYIPERGEVNESEDKTNNKSNLDGEKSAAIQFNNAVRSFYSSPNVAEDQIPFSTNYYINRLTRVKGSDPATRASAMIPVSVNFTTDGISGFTMGHAFTVPDELLPYTYNTRKQPDGRSSLDTVGFVVVGLNHTIESNTWNTSVRATMIFLKDRNDFTAVTSSASPSDVGKLYVNPNASKTENENGDLAKWQQGNVIGYEKPRQFQNVTVLDSSYQKLKELVDAAKKDGISLKINSGYRSYEQQLSIRKKNVNDSNKKQDDVYLKTASPSLFSPETAKPGWSNHQSGIAFDIRTDGADGKKSYEWLVKNAINFGFIRTVPSERWHWEYRPGEGQFSKINKNSVAWNYNGSGNSNTA